MFKLKSFGDILKGKRNKILLLGITVSIIFIIWLSLIFDKYYFTNSPPHIPYKYQKSVRHFLLKPDNSFGEDLLDFIRPNNKMIFKGEKIVHIDLKGAPPKISYYKHLFDLLVKLGATGVLMEYEDMFPYYGPLSNIPATNAYSLDDIKTINNLAKNMNLKLIPLIQTFGHMEFILKLKEWKHLREVPKYPLVICPSHNETIILLKELIDQIIKAHPDSKLIHIGGDEVYSLGLCDKCFLKMNTNRWSKVMLFLHHVSTVANIIKEKYQDMRVLMWDDEFRNVAQEHMEEWKIASLVEPVVWKYSPDIYSYLESSLWDMYANIFPRIWIASAFKGATGCDKFTTNIEYHLENHKSWMQVVSDYSSKIKFEGILITGWQRYDHFAVLCELLPVGIPSLAMSLYLIQGYIDSTQQIASILQCKNPNALLISAKETPKCEFPGGNILEGALELQQLKQKLESLLDDSIVKGWMSDYNVYHQYSNVRLVQSAVENLYMYKMQLLEIEMEMTNNMNQIYDNYTITEWLETYIKPLNNKIEAIWEAKEKLLSKDQWPRRPLRENIDL